jgi:hypothetical protein
VIAPIRIPVKMIYEVFHSIGDWEGFSKPGSRYIKRKGETPATKPIKKAKNMLITDFMIVLLSFVRPGHFVFKPLLLSL